MNARDRRHRAGGAQKVKSVAARLVGDALDEGLQRLAHIAGHLVEHTSVTSTPPKVSASEQPEAHQFPGPHDAAVGAVVAPEPDDLGRSAAYVEHDDRPGFMIGEVSDARDRKMGFRLPVHDLERQAEPLLDLARRNRGRFRPNGRPRWRSCERGSRRAPPSCRDRSSARRAHARSLARSVCPSGHPLAEANDAGKPVDDPEPVRRRPRDQKAAVVGPEIEGGVGRGRADGTVPASDLDVHPHRGRQRARHRTR